MRRALVLAIASLVAASACRNSGRDSTFRPPKPTRSDSGVGTGVDSGPAVDAGFVDSGDPFADSGFPPTPDAGFADSGTGTPDTGVRADSGVPTTAIPVYALQDPNHPSNPGMDGRARLENVVVTAVSRAGATAGSFWVQEAAGGPYSGILVFKPSALPDPAVQVGDRVTLTGTLVEYFDLTEIILETFESATPGTPLAPTTIPPTELANGSPTAEQWEGVFVRIAGVTVLNDMPDAPDDFGEWVVTGGLRIDDQLFRLEPRPTVGTTYTAIIGVHQHTFENYKILPRDAADFVP